MTSARTRSHAGRLPASRLRDVERPLAETPPPRRTSSVGHRRSTRLTIASGRPPSIPLALPSRRWEIPKRPSRSSTRPCGWHHPRAMSRWSGSPGSADLSSRPPSTRTAFPPRMPASSSKRRSSASENSEDEAGLATAWTLLAFLGFMPCRYDQADLAAGRAVEHARRSGEEVLLARALRMRLFSQDLGSATRKRDIGLWTRWVMTSPAVALSKHPHSPFADRSPPERAPSTKRDASRGSPSRISEALGTKGFVAVHEQWLGGVELLAGDPVAAERAFRRSYEIHDEIDNEGNKSTASAFLALALCALGRFDEAELFAATARSVAAEDDLASQVVGRSAMALVLASRDAFDEAERLAREAVQMYARSGMPRRAGRRDDDACRGAASGREDRRR